MHKQGYTYEQIVPEVGYAHRASAQRAVTEALRPTLGETVDELRNLVLEQLDAMWAAIWLKVENGRLVAVDRA